MNTKSIEDLMQQGDLRAVQEFFKELKDINDYIYKDNENETNALHVVCSTDSPLRETLILYLVRCRANINHPGRVTGVSNITPLHLATINGFDPTIKLLLNLGSNVDLKDSNQMTPYDYALRFKLESVKLLDRYRSNYPSSNGIDLEQVGDDSIVIKKEDDDPVILWDGTISKYPISKSKSANPSPGTKKRANKNRVECYYRESKISCRVSGKQN